MCVCAVCGGVCLSGCVGEWVKQSLVEPGRWALIYPWLVDLNDRTYLTLKEGYFTLEAPPFWEGKKVCVPLTC